MTEKVSALHSQYIIDGIRYEATPAELLSECLSGDNEANPESHRFEDIIDESTDPPVTSFIYAPENNEQYLEDCIKASVNDRSFRLLYPESFARQRIAKALIDRIWNRGHFRMGNLNLWAKWSWNTRPLGNMAAFYQSVEAASSYMFDLGIRLNDYIYEETDEESRLDFYAWLPDNVKENSEDGQEEIGLKDSPFQSRHPWISEERGCPEEMAPDASDWMIYIPFDSCSYRIGGSLLAQTQGHNGGIGPHIQDPDYFIDCYEVVRELVEDRIVVAGVTVSDGGLATAAATMCGRCGADLDISGLMASYQETDETRLLFGEVPGVLLQISDNDYDYLDSQLILQDVAYYPVGHPAPSKTGVCFRKGKRSDVAGILASLLEQASEGED